MSRFGKAVKKPIPIDWFRHTYLDTVALHEWVDSFGEKANDHFIWTLDNKLQVKTLEGHSYDVPEGYIIIRGTRGEYYPIDSKIFEETYNVL
jgi:hypothetical protein